MGAEDSDQLSILEPEFRTHLKRLTIWSLFAMGIGGAALIIAPGQFLRAFGAMMIGWSLVNLVICWFAKISKQKPGYRQFREMLSFNQGLNCGYIGIGITLYAASESIAAKGSGAAVTIHGLALLILDAILLHRTKDPSPKG